MDILLKHEDCMLLETFCENLSEECIEAELSMPEYMPDILRIVKSTAEIKTSTCRITGDKASVDGVLTTLRLIGDDKNALLLLDKDLATRTFVAPVIGQK